MVYNDGTHDPYGIVFHFTRNPNPSSVSDTWLESSSTFQSRVQEDQYGACLDLGTDVLVVGAPGDSRQNIHNGAGNECRERERKILQYIQHTEVHLLSLLFSPSSKPLL